jgi:hypothetical protein
MSDRDVAVRLLCEARDILTARLVERVNEAGDNLLDDARGESYGGEIELLFEQIGNRLNQVNVMLSALPSFSEASTIDADAAAGRDIPSAANSRTQIVSAGANPAVATSSFELGFELAGAVASLSPEWDQFRRQILADDLDAAGRTLTNLLDVTPARGRQCVQRFTEAIAEDPQWPHRLASLSNALKHGSAHDSLVLLWDLFGLQGAESLLALHTLRHPG